MSKFLIAVATGVSLWATFASADQAADLAFLKGYDAILAQKNNYTVSFVEASNSKTRPYVLSGSKRDGLHVTLVRVKKKS